MHNLWIYFLMYLVSLCINWPLLQYNNTHKITHFSLFTMVSKPLAGRIWFNFWDTCKIDNLLSPTAKRKPLILEPSLPQSSATTLPFHFLGFSALYPHVNLRMCFVDLMSSLATTAEMSMSLLLASASISFSSI